MLTWEFKGSAGQNNVALFFFVCFVSVFLSFFFLIQKIDLSARDKKADAGPSMISAGKVL